MSTRILQLTGLKSTTLSIAPGLVVYKGQSVKVSLEVAAHLEEGGRNNADGEFVPYWTEPATDIEPTYDMSTEKMVRPLAGKYVQQPAGTNTPAEGTRPTRGAATKNADGDVQVDGDHRSQRSSAVRKRRQVA